MADLVYRQAAIDALGERPMVWTDDDQYTLGERNQYDADRLAIETLPSAQPEQQWIPVSDHLPIPNSVYEDVFVYYLVQNEYGDMMVATFVQFPGGARIWQQMYKDGAIMEDIVAWMPLPEPWRGEKDESGI